MNQRSLRSLARLATVIPALFLVAPTLSAENDSLPPTDVSKTAVVIPPPPPPPVLSDDDSGLDDIEQDVQGLSPRTRDLILTIIEGFRHTGGYGSTAGGAGFMEHLVSITIIVLSLGFPPIVLSIILYFGYKKERLRCNTMLHLAEKGISVSNLDFDPEARRNAPMADYRKGVLYLGFGAGLALFFYLVEWKGGIGIGAIPAFIGVAYIFIHFTRGSGSAK